MATISLENVSFVYGANTPFEIEALDDVSLTVREHSITGVIGHTGSGKSTLVQLLNGLEKPTSGRVLLDGEDIWARPKEMKKIRFRVGLVMQYPEYQLFEETIAADIAFGPRNMGLAEEEIAALHDHAILVHAFYAAEVGQYRIETYTSETSQIHAEDLNDLIWLFCISTIISSFIF